MKFNVPQFLEVEDKVIGPLTFKQFGYLAAGGVVIFLANFYAPNMFVLFLIAIPVALLSLLLAFLKINGRPFVVFLSNFISYTLKPKLYIWRKKR